MKLMNLFIREATTPTSFSDEVSYDQFMNEGSPL